MLVWGVCVVRSDMVTQLLDSMGDDLECKMDECCSTINLSHTETDLEPR